MTEAMARRDRFYALSGAVVFHLLAAIVLTFIRVAPPVTPPPVVEVTFLSVTPPKPPEPQTRVVAGKPKPVAAAAAKKGRGKPVATTRRVALPERQSVSRDEVISVPKAKKLDVPEGSGTARRSGVAGTGRTAERDGSTRGTSAGSASVGRETGTGTGAGRSRPGVSDTETGSSRLGSVQWIGGGKRRKVSGALPRYPAGVNVAAQIKLEAVVAPDGTVRSVRPAQKGNARLEEAAMRELRRWRFEPLPRSIPQRDQRCVVTFNFTLR